jgi:signal transduction histidine kinase
MRRRLTLAIVALVAGTVLVTSVASYFLIRHDSLSTSQHQLSQQAQAISQSLSNGVGVTKVSFRKELRVVSDTGALTGIDVVALTRGGSIGGRLPAGITASMLDIPALRAGRQTVGHTSSLLIYATAPTPLTKVTKFLPVLVITRQIHEPADGLRYFALVGLIGLALSALVAAGLARRFARPLAAAVAATRRIASGDLDATVPMIPHEDPEFAGLAESINAMGANLVRARDQERQFLLSVSHELRTPLTSIRGYADAVVDGATDDPAGAATVISTEARRLERLVGDLLDLARLDADRFSLDLQAVDCSEVVGEVVDSFRPQAHLLGLELVTSPGPDTPLWVEADPDRLGQVVANLLENASSFAEHQIVVGAGLAAGLPVAWVADDGPGIPPDQLDKVFERHFVSDRVSGRRKGSGLGLAIVAELASAMGASVEAQSPLADGHGTTMVVWMRASSPPEVAAPPENASPSEAGAVDPEEHPMHPAGTPGAAGLAGGSPAVVPPAIELPPVGRPVGGRATEDPADGDGPAPGVPSVVDAASVVERSTDG